MLLLYLSYGGTATKGSDYNSTVSTSIAIPAESISANAAVDVTAIQDSDPEGNETVIVSIDSVSKGLEDGEQQATITIMDDDAPVVTGVSLPADNTYTAGNNLDFTLTFSDAVTIDNSGGNPYIELTIGVQTVHAVPGWRSK